MASGRPPRPRLMFLSHCSKDRAFVARLAADLQRAGIGVWYRDTAIVGAQAWHDETGAPLGRCDWFAVILTRHAIASTWVKRELFFALSEKRYRNHIIPVIAAKCDPARLSWTLPALQYVDLTRDDDAGFQCLLAIWRPAARPRGDAT